MLTESQKEYRAEATKYLAVKAKLYPQRDEQVILKKSAKDNLCQAIHKSGIAIHPERVLKNLAKVLKAHPELLTELMVIHATDKLAEHIQQRKSHED